MADIVFNCSYCNESLIVDARGIGLEVPCPHCLHKIAIPEDAEPVDDPSSIIEVEAPEHSVKDTAVEKSTPEENAADADSSDDDDEEPPAGEELSEDSAQTVLSLLESLLESQPGLKPDAAEARSLIKQAENQVSDLDHPVSVIDGKLVQAITELKGRMDQMYQAYRDAGDRVENLTHENVSLKERIEAAEVEREGLSARLDDFSEAVNFSGILSKHEGSSEEKARFATNPMMFLKRLRMPYQVAAGLVVFSTICVLYGLYQSTTETGRKGKQGVEKQVVAKITQPEEVTFHELQLKTKMMFAPVQFSVVDVKIGSGAELSGYDQADLSEDEEFIVVRADLANKEADRAVHLHYLWDDTELVDNEGNVYKRRLERIVRAVENAKAPADALMPNEEAQGTVIFDAPSKSATSFTLRCRPSFWLENKRGEKERMPADGFLLSFHKDQMARVSSN